MPDFPEPIKNLISRLLTVDPDKRITLAQIKHHPAFKTSIPKNYVFPGALPLINIGPVDISTLDESVFKVLRQIGFKNKSELEEQLKSESQNFAKLFCMMLEQQISIDMLPWPEDDQYDDEDSASSPKDHFIEQQDDDFAPIGYVVQNEDSLFQAKAKFSTEGSSSFSVYSFADRASWVPEVANGLAEAPYQTSSTMCELSVTLEELVSTFQRVLNEEGFDWFYPNDVLLVARRKSDLIDVVISIEYEKESTLKAVIQLVKGDSSYFGTFMKMLVKSVNDITTL